MLIRIRPLSGEALSGFMKRFAYKNVVDFLALWRHVKSKQMTNPQVPDMHLIDFAPRSVINLHKLSTVTQTPIEAILEMTFFNLLKKFSHSDRTSESRILRESIREVYHYCPYCLNENAIVKLLWKIRSITICIQHKCMLLSHCNNCGGQLFFNNKHSNIGQCPSCAADLTRFESTLVLDEIMLKQQKWLVESWESLLVEDHIGTIESSEVAQRLIYILNDYKEKYDIESIRIFCEKNSILLDSLLQCARNSYKQKRSVHINQILRICYLKDKSITDFFNIALPDTFISGLNNSNVSENKSTSCIAPWCSSYNQSGSLKITGNKFKRLKSGELLRNELICVDCGCRYAFDENGERVEKDNFINGFQIISVNEDIQAIELSKCLNIQASKCRHIIAYFQARNKNTIWDNELLERIIKGVSEGIGLEVIKKWTCWNNRDHYLLYRYHIDVIRGRVSYRKRGFRRVNWETIIIDIEKTCNSLLEQNLDITLGAIASAVNVSDKTIYKSPIAHETINKFKLMQKQQRRKKWVEKLCAQVDEYIVNFEGKRLLSKEIYNYIKVKQSYLVEAAPEVNDYIFEKRSSFKSDKLIKRT